MATLRLDGDSSGLEEAVARAQRAVQRLEDEMRAKKFPMGSPEADKLAEQLERARQSAARLSDQLDRSRTPASRWESNIRSAEAAGRLLGGRMGELTGAFADFGDIVENGLSPIGAAGLAVAAVGVAAVGTVAGMVQLTQAAIDIARETDAMNAELLDAERALADVDRVTQSLILSMGTRAAPAVASMSFALSGLITVADDTANAVGDATPDGLGSVLLAQAALTYPMTTAAVMGLAEAYGALESRGRAAAEQQERVALGLSESDMLNALGLFEDSAATSARERAQAAQQRQAQQARAEAARQAEEARRERERGLDEQMAAAQAAHDFAFRLDRERAEANAAFIAGAQGLQFQSLAQTMAAEDEANAARVEAARQAAALVAQQWEQSYAIQRESAFTAVNAAIGLLSDLVGENREAAIAMFAVRQAAAIAESIVNTQVAATRAVAELGPAAGPPAAVAIVAAGAVSTGIIAAQSVIEGASTFGSGRQTQAAASQTFNLVVDGNSLRNAVRPYGGSARFGQRA